MPLREERERAHRLATGMVSGAIALVGVTLVVFAVLLVVKGGLAFLFLSLILLVLGAGITLLGLFFQLVPLKLAELAQLKRERDLVRLGPDAANETDATRPGGRGGVGLVGANETDATRPGGRGGVGLVGGNETDATRPGGRVDVRGDERPPP